MKKTNKKGFTIVELVIVIAVIGILAAVLIPTFGGIIDSANRAVDTQLVAQINTILAIEDVLGGGVNDAVEIQKVIKENGLKLETKVKGQYIWYDIENKKVVLGGLNENGFVPNGASSRSATKGQFIAAISPESFVEGYLFLSTESADGLAESIHALRDPKGDPVKTISDAIANIKKKNAVLGTNLESFMNTTAVMTNDGTFCINSENKSNIDRVIVGSDMPEVTTKALGQLAEYRNVVVVDLHSGVTSIDGQKATTDLAHIFFVYNSEGIAEIDKEYGGLNNNLITLNERSNYLHTIYWVDCIYDPNTGDATISEKKNEVAVIKAAIYEFNYDFSPFAYVTKEGTADTSYDFVSFSLNKNGIGSTFKLDGSSTYALTDAERYRIDEEGYLTIYRVYYKASSDFKIGEAYYSSKTVTSMLAENGEASLPDGTKTITVVSTNAVLDASLIGEKSVELTIPSGVELLLPYQADFTKGTTDLTGGSYNKANYLPGAKYNKDEMTGKTNLEIKGNVNLILQGSIYVDGALYHAATSNQCFITDNCGVLELAEGAKITSTGFITAFGVIRGEGTIDAKSGTVDEIMSIYDWYGGSNAAVATGALGNNGGKIVTPFNNWKVENIRSIVTIHPAVEYSALSGIYIDETKPVDFLLTSSDANKKPLFVLSSDALVERSTSDNGNAKITIKEGSASDTAKSLSVPDVALGIDANVDFATTSLPLSHFDVCIDEGAELTLSYNIYKVLPGSHITVNGTLNLNTEVVICNSFDLQFESFTTHTAYDNVLNTVAALSKYEHTYTSVSADGKTVTFSSQKMKGFKLFGIQYWEKDGSAVTKTAPMPHTYPDEGAATFTVNGTLKFNNDNDVNTNAAFAGEILGSKDAVISVTGTVKGYTIEEGYYIAVSGAGGTWYDAHDPAQHSATVMVGVNNTAGTLAAGTYKFVSSETSQGSVNQWVLQK